MTDYKELLDKTTQSLQTTFKELYQHITEPSFVIFVERFDDSFVEGKTINFASLNLPYNIFSKLIDMYDGVYIDELESPIAYHKMKEDIMTALFQVFGKDILKYGLYEFKIRK